MGDASPSFGITTRAMDSAEDFLEKYRVFGRIVPNANAVEFLDKVQEVPTFSSSAAQLQQQRIGGMPPIGSEFIRKLATSSLSLGGSDSGANEKEYDGKLLRRVEVFRVQPINLSNI